HRFGGDPNIVGRVVTLNGQPHTIVGILPPDFFIPNWENDIFVALNLANDGRRADRSINFLRTIARLAPGATMGSAQAEFTTLTERSVKQFPVTDATIT